MKVFLVSNNSLLEGLNYEIGTNLDLVRFTRPLSIEGESVAKSISNNSVFQNVSKIYSSFYTGAISSAKYLAASLELEIHLSEEFNDCKVGYLGSKNMKMVKGMQDHDFNYHLDNGESLWDVGIRLKRKIKELLRNNEDIVIFTHKRAILGYLLIFTKVGYNLDDNLILEFKGKQVYDDSDKEYDIYELTFADCELIDIKVN